MKIKAALLLKVPVKIVLGLLIRTASEAILMSNHILQFY